MEKAIVSFQIITGTVFGFKGIQDFAHFSNLDSAPSCMPYQKLRTSVLMAVSARINNAMLR